MTAQMRSLIPFDPASGIRAATVNVGDTEYNYTVLAWALCDDHGDTWVEPVVLDADGKARRIGEIVTAEAESTDKTVNYRLR